MSETGNGRNAIQNRYRKLSQMSPSSQLRMWRKIRWWANQLIPMIQKLKR